jgi:hypothetical protein
LLHKLQRLPSAEHPQKDSQTVDLAGINQDALDALCREEITKLAQTNPQGAALLSERLRRAENTINAYRNGQMNGLYSRNNLGNAEAAK